MLQDWLKCKDLIFIYVAVLENFVEDNSLKEILGKCTHGQT